jgi:hypothetical protein
LNFVLRTILLAHLNSAEFVPAPTFGSLLSTMIRGRDALAAPPQFRISPWRAAGEFQYDWVLIDGM